jgi:hypothetical protein
LMAASSSGLIVADQESRAILRFCNPSIRY